MYYFAVGEAIYGMILYLFYQSILVVLICTPITLLYVKQKKKKLMEERKTQLNVEFRDGIISISNALNAGFSIENAFGEAITDLRSMYGAEADIVKEFEYILIQLKRNRTIEEALQDLANRSSVEDIKTFSEVFSTAKRTGGDIIKIIRTTSKNIGAKIEIQREITTLVTAKKFEAKIMNIVPFGLILYMWIFSPGFLDPLYHNLLGVFIMTIGLTVYYGAYRLSLKIINVEI